MGEQISEMIERTQMIDLDQTTWMVTLRQPGTLLLYIWWFIFLGLYSTFVWMLCRYYSRWSMEEMRLRNYRLDNAIKLLTLRDGLRVLHPDIDASALDHEIRTFPEILVSGDFSPDQSPVPSGREGAFYTKFKSNMDAPPQDDYLPPIPPPPSLTRQTGISPYVV